MLRVVLNLVAAAALLITSGCKYAYTNANREVIVVKSAFDAFDCDNVCKSMSIDIELQNNTSRLYCVSREFTEFTAASHVTIRNIRTNVTHRNTFTTGIIAPRFLDNESAFLSESLSDLNIVIQPNSRAKFNAYLENYFEIPRSQSEATFNFLTYPCTKSELNRLGYIKLSTKGPLNMEP